MTHVVQTLTQTCPSNPSQWEGTTDDGAVYVRYRWGWLNIGFGPTLDDAVRAAIDDAADPDACLRTRLGGPFDGYLSYAELQAAAPEVVWP